MIDRYDAIKIINSKQINRTSKYGLEMPRDYCEKNEERKKLYDTDLEAEGITCSQMPRFYPVSYVKQRKTRQLNL